MRPIISLSVLLALFAFSTEALADQTVALKLVDQHGVPIAGSTISVGTQTVTTDATMLLAEGSHSFALAPAVLGEASASLLQRSETAAVTASTTELVFEWITSPVTFRVHDQGDIDIPASQIRMAAYNLATSFFDNAASAVVPITEGYANMSGSQADGYQLRVIPGTLGDSSTFLLRREEIQEVLASTTAFSYEWLTTQVTFRVHDQHGVDIPGSQIRMAGYPFGASFFDNGTSATVAVTEGYANMSGSQVDGYVLRVIPGTLGESSTFLLRREETQEALASPNEFFYEWATTQVTFRVRDQHGADIPASQIRMSAYNFATSFFDNGASATVAVTEGYANMFGSQMDGYSLRILPAVLGESNTFLLRREEKQEALALPNDFSYEWITTEVTFGVHDQDGLDTPGSQIRMAAYSFATSFFGNGATAVVPVTEGYADMSGSQANGYLLYVIPGLAGAASTAEILRREALREVLPATNALAYEWIQFACPLQLLDVNDVPVAGTTLELPAPFPALNPGDLVALPVNDAATYPNLFGDLSAGYAVTVTPGDIDPLFDIVDVRMLPSGEFDPASFAIGGNTYQLVCGGFEPTAAPSGSGVFEIDAAVNVTLGGSVADLDGDLLTYTWKEGATVLSGPDVIQAPANGDPVALPNVVINTLALGLGVHTIELLVDDGQFEASAEVTIEIIDTAAPVVMPSASTTVLWPPNHQMIEVTILANASDASGGAVSLSVDVTSNQPINGPGDGNTDLDWEILEINQATGLIRINLRAERSGGSARVYSVTIAATDASGNVSMAVPVDIVVPKSKGK